MKKPDHVVTCLETTLPNVNLELSQKKKNKKPFDFKALMKQVNDHRDKHGTSKKEDYREDALTRIPASLLRVRHVDWPGGNFLKILRTTLTLWTQLEALEQPA